MAFNIKVNGTARSADVDGDTPLLWVLRDVLGMTGTKFGCGAALCGACTVHVDGVATRSCQTPTGRVTSAEITTIEGLGTPKHLHPMQAAFVRHDGYQCGYCTPGQICSAVAALDEIKAGIPSHVSADLNAPMEITVPELRERMSGNICRCGAYSNIVDAITEVAGSKV